MAFAESSPTVGVVEPGEVRPVAAMLARAFDDDPVMGYLLGSAHLRGARLRSFFGALLGRLVLPSGVATAAGGGASAALWSPPDASGALGAFSRPGQPNTVRPGELWSLLRVALPFGHRMVTTARDFSQVGKHHPTYPHWYLMVLGTEPARQGQGLGSAALGPVLRRCDEEGLPAYLESSKERNVPFYARHGFEVTATLTLGGEGPTMWCMERPPRAT